MSGIAEIGDRIGRAAVWHLDEMYPRWKDAVPRTARSSLRNFIAQQVAVEVADLLLESEGKKA